MFDTHWVEVFTMTGCNHAWSIPQASPQLIRVAMTQGVAPGISLCHYYNVPKSLNLKWLEPASQEGLN